MYACNALSLCATGFADAAQDPKDFPTAPAKAVPRALRMAGVATSDISLHEINEAFSVVVRANEKVRSAAVGTGGRACAPGQGVLCACGGWVGEIRAT
jgi:acetyl-CoA C-acetyltransferase